MNAKQLIAAVALITSAGAVFAQEATHGFLGNETSVAAASNAQTESKNVIVPSKTRAEVVAELKQAEKDGTLQKASYVGLRAPESVTESAAPQAVAHK